MHIHLQDDNYYDNDLFDVDEHIHHDDFFIDHYDNYFDHDDFEYHLKHINLFFLDFEHDYFDYDDFVEYKHHGTSDYDYCAAAP